MGYYIVTAQFGHVGRNNYLIKSIPVFSENGREAAYKVRWMARAKHHKKDAIIKVISVCEENYISELEAHNNDPYFRAKSKQEQIALCGDMSDFVRSYEKKERKKTRRASVQYRVSKSQMLINEAIKCMHQYDEFMEEE